MKMLRKHYHLILTNRRLCRFLPEHTGTTTALPLIISNTTNQDCVIQGFYFCLSRTAEHLDKSPAPLAKQP